VYCNKLFKSGEGIVLMPGGGILLILMFDNNLPS